MEERTLFTMNLCNISFQEKKGTHLTRRPDIRVGDFEKDNQIKNEDITQRRGNNWIKLGGQVILYVGKVCT